MTDREKEIYEYAKQIFDEKKESFDTYQYQCLGNYTERCVELPWVATCINKYNINSILDVGFTFASHDYLRFMLDYSKKHLFIGTDIISPSRVKGRYPSQWWADIANVKVEINDISKKGLDVKEIDAVTIISTLEHIGFDKESGENEVSSFQRPKNMKDVDVIRADNIEDIVLDNVSISLKKEGLVLLSVPAGKGGPTILKDSMGYFACEWEYNRDSWNKIISHRSFDCLEQRFFAQENGIWIEKTCIDKLKNYSAEMKSCASAVAMCILRKK